MFVTSKRFAGQYSRNFKAGLGCAAISAFLLAGASAHATPLANLVQNGNFAENTGPGQINEDTTITDWTSDYVNQTSGYNFLFIPGDSNPSGEDGAVGLYTVTSGPAGGPFVAADADYQVGSFYQTINGLTAGKTYDLSFEWAAAQQTGYYGPTQQWFQVSLGSQTQNTAVYHLPGEVQNGITIQNFSGWRPDEMTFTATGSSEVLSFLAQGSPQVPPFTLLDDVSLVQTPEPGTTTLLFTGLIALAGFGLFSRRRRAQQAL